MRNIAAGIFALSGLAFADAAAEPTNAERAACQVDAFKYCRHAIPDRDNVRACLRENMRRLNTTCRGAIQRSRK